MENTTGSDNNDRRLGLPVQIMALLALCAAVIAVYYPALGAPFILDDTDNIIDNSQMRDLSSFWPPSNSRLLTFFSFALNYHFYGAEPWSYHLVNIALHLLNTLLIFALARLILRSGRFSAPERDKTSAFLVAFTAAALFALHPVQTQAVAYITQRFASLATFFYLLSFASYAAWRTGKDGLPGTAFYALSLISAAAAMITKEISFTLPAVLVLYEAASFGLAGLKKRIVPLIPLLLTMLIIPLVIFGPEMGLWKVPQSVYEMNRQQQMADIANSTSYQYFIEQCRVIITYLRLLFIPVGQNIDHDYPVYKSFFDPNVFLSFFALAAIFVSAVMLFIRAARKGNPYLALASAGVVWFFIALSIESSVIPILDLMFEHRLYLPDAGAFIAAAAGLCMLAGYISARAGFRKAVVLSVLLALLIVPLAGAAYARTRIWSSNLTLWADSVSKSPNKARPHSNLGLAYMQLGRMNEAEREFKRAIVIMPEKPGLHFNLGLVYYYTGRYQQAVDEYKILLAAVPDAYIAKFHQGMAYKAMGRLDEAEDSFRGALAINPDFKEAYQGMVLVNRVRERGLSAR